MINHIAISLPFRFVICLCIEFEDKHLRVQISKSLQSLCFSVHLSDFPREINTDIFI